MSITASTEKSHRARARAALVSVVSLGLMGGPLAWAAAPAAAATSLRGCTVDPLKPTDEHGRKADFKIRVSCNGPKTVQIRQERYEDDPGGRRNDDFLGRDKFTETFDRSDKRVTINSIDNVPNLDRRGAEEVYQIVSFRVRNNNNDNWSDWTSWEKSDVATVRP